jgi:thioredoxin 1
MNTVGTVCAQGSQGRTVVDIVNANQDDPPLAEVGEANFEAEVLRSKQPVLVAFWAPWSRPCQILDSVLDEVAAACAGKLKVVKADADDNPDLSLQYDIQSIPTLLYFVEGCARAKVVGTASKEAILARLQFVAAGGEAG